MAFLDQDFLLGSPTAKHLFHQVAVDQPIIDYHNHLVPGEILGDRKWNNLTEVWLDGDHYKWRALRANGVKEDLITNRSADPYDRFFAWASTMPMLVRNPLYHWTHLELRRVFGWDGLLNESTAPEVWETANAKLAGISARGLLGQFKVEVVGTTDDPADSLDTHTALGREFPSVGVYPTYRPDAAFLPSVPERFNGWIAKLSGATGMEAGESLESFLSAMEQRHADFHAIGARLSDHSLPSAPSTFLTSDEARSVFTRARAGEAITSAEADGWTGFLLARIAAWNHERGWTMQLHLGAVRNPNSRLFEITGPDGGFDTIGDWTNQGGKLLAFLDHCDRAGALPRTVVYNLNPADNYPLCAALGSFQNSTTPGKLQFGSGWWFLDQLDGMRWQLNTVSQLGLLSRFIGMLTDSRSFLSFVRHEYFRRLLCDIIGGEVERGEIPDDPDLLSKLVRGVCYENARAYFAFPCHS